MSLDRELARKQRRIDFLENQNEHLTRLSVILSALLIASLFLTLIGFKLSSDEISRLEWYEERYGTIEHLERQDALSKVPECEVAAHSSYSGGVQ